MDKGALGMLFTGAGLVFESSIMVALPLSTTKRRVGPSAVTPAPGACFGPDYSQQSRTSPHSSSAPLPGPRGLTAEASSTMQGTPTPVNGALDVAVATSNKMELPHQLALLSGGSGKCLHACLVALRAACLCSKVIACGWAQEAYPQLIALLDFWFPGQFGQLNHSVKFLRGFKTSLLETGLREQRAAVHSVLPALRIYSDFVRTFDSVTPKTGDTLLEEVLYTTDVDGRIAWHLLDMVHVQACSEARRMDES
jgi:hypothetical protein